MYEEDNTTNTSIKVSSEELYVLESIVSHNVNKEDLEKNDFVSRESLKGLALKIGITLLEELEYIQFNEKELWYFRDRLSIKNELTRKLKLKIYAALRNKNRENILIEDEKTIKKIILNETLWNWEDNDAKNLN